MQSVLRFCSLYNVQEGVFQHLRFINKSSHKQTSEKYTEDNKEAVLRRGQLKRQLREIRRSCARQLHRPIFLIFHEGIQRSVLWISKSVLSVIERFRAIEFQFLIPYTGSFREN